MGWLVKKNVETSPEREEQACTYLDHTEYNTPLY